MAYRVPSHQLSVGHNLHQVDNDNHRVQNVGQKHVLVQGHSLTTKAPATKRNRISPCPDADAFGRKPL